MAEKEVFAMKRGKARGWKRGEAREAKLRLEVERGEAERRDAALVEQAASLEAASLEEAAAACEVRLYDYHKVSRPSMRAFAATFALNFAQLLW